MKNFVLSLIFALFLCLGLVFADSNGVWTFAEDIRNGTFGSDEGFGDFSFQNNVGIGTITPRTNLEVNGRIFLTSFGITPTSGVGLFASYNPTFNSGLLQAYDYDLSSPRNILLQVAGGNIGIGTISPTAKLEVNGDIKANNIYSNNKKLVVEPPICVDYSYLQWTGTDWNCKVVCAPSCPTPNTVCSGTTDTRADGCGGNCNVVGTSTTGSCAPAQTCVPNGATTKLCDGQNVVTYDSCDDYVSTEICIVGNACNTYVDAIYKSCVPCGNQCGGAISNYPGTYCHTQITNGVSVSMCKDTNTGATVAILPYSWN